MGSTSLGAPAWGYFSTCVIGQMPWDPHAVSSEAEGLVYGAVSSRHYQTHAPAHARCAYCGTARKPFTFTNCINCGAPA